MSYYDRNGRELSTEEWSRLFSDAQYRRVALDETPNGKVSTVWLGLDHAFSERAMPLIFETMVFGGPLDGECERYAFEEDAVAGHAAMLARCQDGGR